ncbi:MAG: hypothetical protein QOJ07_2513 [Thermoleophilaceae bacterium]|jgi:hypothetical protein|nr:hypothetical protein [Thermoleophilaceae bacterium]
MRHASAAALVAVALLAGCGEAKLDPDVGRAEFAVNQSPDNIEVRAAVDGSALPAVASQQLGARGVDELKRRLGGAGWSVTAKNCKPSGPIVSCDLELEGQARAAKKRVLCQTSGAVRVLGGGRATVKRPPWVCSEAR